SELTILAKDETVTGRAAELASAARPARRRSRSRNRVRAALTPYLFIAPGAILFAVCIVYPMVQAVQMSFFDWKIIGSATSEFLGLDNYVRALNDDNFWLSLSNNGLYMLFTVPPKIVLGLAVALLLKKKGPAQPLFRVLFYLPVVTSWVVVSLLFKYLFA